MYSPAQRVQKPTRFAQLNKHEFCLQFKNIRCVQYIARSLKQNNTKQLIEKIKCTFFKLI